MAHEAGKGDTQRPTNHQKFAESFERIFGKRPPQNVAEEVKGFVALVLRVGEWWEWPH